MVCIVIGGGSGGVLLMPNHTTLFISTQGYYLSESYFFNGILSITLKTIL